MRYSDLPKIEESKETILEMCSNPENKAYADISAFDTSKLSATKCAVLARGLGFWKMWGDVSHLDMDRYTDQEVIAYSLRTGNDPITIDHPLHSVKKMLKGITYQINKLCRRVLLRNK